MFGFKKPKHFNGTGFDNAGAFTNSPKEINIEERVIDEVNKYNINENLMSDKSFELQLRILYTQIKLYELGEEDLSARDYCRMYKNLAIGVAELYQEIIGIGYGEWKKKKPINVRISEARKALSTSNSIEMNVRNSSKIVALTNLKEGNLYYLWDLENDVSPIVINPAYIEISENKYNQWLPGRMARTLNK